MIDTKKAVIKLRDWDYFYYFEEGLCVYKKKTSMRNFIANGMIMWKEKIPKKIIQAIPTTKHRQIPVELLLKMLKTSHSFHLVDPSPWPLLASLGGLMLTTGSVLYMHKFSGGFQLLSTGFITILFVMYVWWRDIVREATFEDKHSPIVQRSLRLGVILFIVTEAAFFAAFFWAFFHSSTSPTFNIGGVWPPKAITPVNAFGIPLINTFFLLTSGASVTWAHLAINAGSKRLTIAGLWTTVTLAILFTCLQGYEYRNAPFCISDGIYGSCFYMTTGFHGFHVIVGTIAIFVSLIRTALNHFTTKQHLGLDFAIWYWHFVDVVWLLLYVSIYWWGNS